MNQPWDLYASYIHLKADFFNAVKWAGDHGKRWVFTDRNAARSDSSEYALIEELDELCWEAIKATYWEPAAVQIRKQAEFLVEEFFPWELFTHIGTESSAIKNQVEAIVGKSSHKPKVMVRKKLVLLTTASDCDD